MKHQRVDYVNISSGSATPARIEDNKTNEHCYLNVTPSGDSPTLNSIHYNALVLAVGGSLLTIKPLLIIRALMNLMIQFNNPLYFIVILHIPNTKFTFPSVILNEGHSLYRHPA